MIPLCSRFDSMLFTPKMSAIASYGNYSRSPIGLFAGIDREIVQKQVERLLRYAEPAPVGHGAHYAGTREAVDDARKRRVHLVRRRDLIANEPAFGTVAARDRHQAPAHLIIPDDGQQAAVLDDELLA